MFFGASSSNIKIINIIISISISIISSGIRGGPKPFARLRQLASEQIEFARASGAETVVGQLAVLSRGSVRDDHARDAFFHHPVCM